MFKLCRWLYQLGYDKGWEDAKRDEQDKRRMSEAVKKMYKDTAL